jgi:hypothetical protein
MSNRKRDREVELGKQSTASTPTDKRARLDNADTHDKAYDYKDYIDNFDCDLLIVWSQKITDNQKRFLTIKIEELVRLRSAADFIKPHSGKSMPRDARSTKKSMDFSTMRSLLNTGKYSSVKDLVVDFSKMISNVAEGLNHDESVIARRLLKCFCDRMKDCPTGPDGGSMKAYNKHDLKLMAAQITDAASKVTKQSSKDSEVISIEDSDSDKGDEVAIEPETIRYDVAFNDLALYYEGLTSNPSIPFDSASRMPNEFPTTSKSETAKTPEPDDFDEETRQLQKEIQERQQKLANMAEKKKLLAEIKDLDTATAALDSEIPEANEQFKQIELKVRDLGQEEDAALRESKEALDSSDWHYKQRERLQKEIERLHDEYEKHQQEEARLCSVTDEHLQKAKAVLTQKKQVQEQAAQVLDSCIQLKDRRDRLENQRATAKSRLEELGHGTL